MTPSPPPDTPLFRGNELTPESPLPVHVPEPANIPVLENQIDPIFNLMSTHLSSGPPPMSVPAMDPATFSTEISLAAGEGDMHAASAEGTRNERTQEQDNTEKETALPAEHVVSQQTKSESVEQGSLTHAAQALDIADPASVATQAGAMSASEAHEPAPNPSEDQSQAMGAGAAASASAEAHFEPVNYQALIDNIIPSNNAETASEIETAALPAADVSENPQSASLLSPSHSFAGLPPRPPPQEKPAIHPNYHPEEDIRAYHYPNLAQAPTTPQNGAFPNAPPFPAAAPAPGASGLPIAPPPSAAYPASGGSNHPPDREQQARNVEAARRANVGDRHDKTPWAPEIQKLYDKFLTEEQVYTAEGTWDRFPKDSRLFVGNLPTDVVTKRDIFHIFYRYGRLAQISIKNAYGFVQFMDASACRTAMHSEQGKKIKEKSMHLEISKPPKNSRNAAVSAAGERLRASHYRRSRSRSRSRSPDTDRRPGSRGDRDRYNRGRAGRRDDYRPGRSPSPPRGGRSDVYRRRDRSRSPYGRYRRSPTPPRLRSGHGNSSNDSDDGLPLPRRHPREVPEVQIVVIDNIDRAVVDFVQNAFRARGFSVQVFALWQEPGISLEGFITRQMSEGVLAVANLFQSSQATGTLHLQLFDRTRGRGNVRWSTWDNLSPDTAANIVHHSKQTQGAVALNAQSGSQPQNFGATLQQLGINLPPAVQQPPPQQNQPPTQQSPTTPNLASLITQLDGPSLQKLLGAMQPTPQTPQSAGFPTQQQSPTQNLSFASFMAGAPPPQQQGQQGQPPPANPSGDPRLANFLQLGAQPGQQHQQRQPQQNQPYSYAPNGPPPSATQVQDIMSQLAQWKR